MADQKRYGLTLDELIALFIIINAFIHCFVKTDDGCITIDGDKWELSFSEETFLCIERIYEAGKTEISNQTENPFIYSILVDVYYDAKYRENGIYFVPSVFPRWKSSATLRDFTNQNLHELEESLKSLQGKIETAIDELKKSEVTHG